MKGLIERAMGPDSVAAYEGMCGEIADQILHVAGDGDILYVESRTGILTPSYDVALSWRYHQVAVVRGRVYDPWSPWRPCTIGTYLRRVFPGQPVSIAINGDDVDLPRPTTTTETLTPEPTK